MGPPYGYPRFATHAYAALFEVGNLLVRSARTAVPKARSTAVVTNAAEPRLDNRFTYRLIESWRAHGATIETHEFPLAQGLPHDLIDPGKAAQSTALVYPILSGERTAEKRQAMVARTGATARPTGQRAGGSQGGSAAGDD